VGYQLSDWATLKTILFMGAFMNSQFNLKSAACMKLLGVGMIALTLAIAISEPSFAKKKPKVTVTTSPGNSTNSTVVPTVPITPPGAMCPSPGVGTPIPCVMPIPMPPEPVAASKDYFSCGTSSHGIPTTFVSTPHENIPLIRWVSNHFTHSGYSPQARCQDVSQRFNRYYNQGILNYVTTGYVNNMPVICVASDKGGPCTEVLFTLKPGENATRVIQQLFDVRAGASGPLYENESRIYIDIKAYMQASR
jgi:Circadian oscillating protein COP23